MIKIPEAPKRMYIFFILEDGEYRVASGYNRVEVKFGSDLEEAIKKAKEEKRFVSRTLPPSFPTKLGEYEIISLDDPYAPTPPNKNMTYAQYYDELVRG